MSTVPIFERFSVQIRVFETIRRILLLTDMLELVEALECLELCRDIPTIILTPMAVASEFSRQRFICFDTGMLRNV